MLIFNLKIAFRNLLKYKGFSLINIGGLAIGMTCCLMLLLYVNYEWSYDKQFRNIDRIYAVCKNYKASGETLTYGATDDALPQLLGPASVQNIPQVEYASRIARRWGILFNYAQNSYKRNVYFVEPSFLKILDYHFIKGNPATALTDPNAILITESTAKSLFGTTDPIGKSVKLDNRKYLHVTAVIADPPKNQTYKFDVLLTWALFEQESPWLAGTDWGSGFCNTVIQLKDPDDFKAADAQIRKMISANQPKSKAEAFLFPLKKSHLYNNFENGRATGGKIDEVKLFLFLAFCVLLIACINYMNLSTARSEKRAREVGVRKTLGSSRRSIALQFFAESLLLSFFAIGIAFVLTEAALPYFNNLLDIQMLISYNSFELWATLLLLLLFTGFVAGSYPAFYLSSFVPVRVLKGFNGAGRSSLPLRRILVVLQFGFSICMIISAIIIYNQIHFIEQKPLGFDQNNLVQIERSGEFKTRSKAELFKAELFKAGVISSATEMSNGLTNGGDNSSAFEWPGKFADEIIVMNYRATGFHFMKTIGAKMLLGRDFSEKFALDSSAVILNESTVRAMRLKQPIGTRIRWDKAVFTVIGVVKDYNYESTAFKVSPTLFFSAYKETNVLLFRLNPTQNLSRSIQKIRDIGAAINPAYPTDIQFIDQNMADKFRNERTMGVLSNLFGGFAIFISCLGLLGLVLYIAEQRKKEISIRKVLGADMKNILMLLNRDFIKLVLYSNLIAFPVAYIFSTNWLQKYDYRIAVSVWPFLLAASISLLITLLTISVQTFKIAASNPADALKHE